MDNRNPGREPLRGRSTTISRGGSLQYLWRGGLQYTRRGEFAPWTIDPTSPINKASDQNVVPRYLFGELSPRPGFPRAWQRSVFSPAMEVRWKNPQPQISFQSPSSSVIERPNPSKSDASPTEGLIYNPTLTTFGRSRVTYYPAGQHVPFFAENPDFSRVQIPRISFAENNTSFKSPAQIDPFYTQGEALKSSDQIDESWVTIFGFPPASSSYILQQFSQYGNIVDHKIPPSRNWMHVKYQSKLQAKRAICKNGKVFCDSIMVAVKPCIESDLMDSYKENFIVETSLAAVPNSSQNEVSEQNTLNLKNIRSLTQGYQSPNSPFLVPEKKPWCVVS